MQTTVTKHWFIVVSYLVLYLHWLSCFSGASEVKSLLSPNVSSKAIVPKTAYSKQVFLDKRCPFLFLEFLDGSIELLHAIQGTPLWSIRSEKVFLANKEEQPSVLDHCILGPDYRLYVLKEDGLVPYFLGNKESLLTLYRVDTSALFMELDTGRVLKEVEFYSDEDPFSIPCMEEDEDTCAVMLKQYQAKSVGIVFRKFVGLRMYDANTGKSYFANFSRFEPSNFMYDREMDEKVEGSLPSSLNSNLWYGRLLIDTRQLSLKDEDDRMIWSRSFETPIVNVIALGDMFKKERKVADSDWISFSSLEMISDVPNNAWSIETEEPTMETDALFFSKKISFWIAFLQQHHILVIICTLLVGCVTLILYNSKKLSRSLKLPFVHLEHASKDRKVAIPENGSQATNEYIQTENALNSEEHKIGKLILTNRILGLGSHGTVVFEGRLDRDGRKVAVKRMLKTFYELARKEIEMLIALDELSPYVVHYYAMEEDNVFVYLALELCDRTLEEQVQLWKESLPVSSTCYVPILRQIMYGLMDLHRYGVVHRDLKPQNILVIEPKKYSAKERLSCEQYRIKIADVGLAKKLNTNTTLAYITNGSSMSNRAEGSYGWRAAEVLNKRNQNTSLDIFAAGCIFYFVLTNGKHPFGDSVYERESKICKGDFNLTELETLELWDAKDLIEKMIALNPSARPCAKQVLAHPFFWSDMKKLSFLADVSDRLSFFKNGTGLRENKELIASFEKHCRIVLTCINSSYSRVSWATKIDSCVLIAPNSRNYDTTSTCDLLRLIRNKRSHYNELPASVQQTLGKLPCYDREENLNHNFWQYFHRRFPKLLITVYTFVIERQEFLEDTHLQGYGISQRNNPIDSNDTTIDGHSRRYSMELSSTTKTEWRKLRGKERKQYSIELLQQLKPDHLLPPYSLG